MLLFSPRPANLFYYFPVFLFFVALLDDQPGQYWIYANTDNELATVHIKVDCE